MHEMSIVEALLQALAGELRAHPEARVRAVCVRVGQLRLVEPSMLEFCYAAATRGTSLRDSRLEIERVDAAARCGVCSLEFDVEDNWFECPRCRSANVRLLRGDELDLVSLELEEARAERGVIVARPESLGGPK
jgi:hydrogenase nickel incorporation protein HypA/HybF